MTEAMVQKQKSRWPLWRKLCIVIGTVLIASLMVNPEMFAAFGFLLDAAVFDAFLMVLGFQLQQISGDALGYARSFGEGLFRRLAALAGRSSA